MMNRQERFLICVALIIGFVLVGGMLIQSHSPVLVNEIWREEALSQMESEMWVLEINTATEEQLRLLPGIGETLAERIVKLREARGGFHSIEELLEVQGIGIKLLEKLRSRLIVIPPEEKIETSSIKMDQ